MPGNCQCQVNPLLQPAMRVITAITNATQALITTGDVTYPAGVLTITPVSHLYDVGTIVRINVPQCDGMREINGLTGTILTVPTPTTFTIDIDTTGFTPFALYGGGRPSHCRMCHGRTNRGK